MQSGRKKIARFTSGIGLGPRVRALGSPAGRSNLVRQFGVPSLVRNLWVGSAKKFARLPSTIELGFGPP